jgi:hypothetical protein
MRNYITYNKCIQTLLFSHSLLLSKSFQPNSFGSLNRSLSLFQRNSYSQATSSRDNIVSCTSSNIISSESSEFFSTMPRGVKKENLPTKICVTCNRPFTWRKKWEKVWDEVSTCSKSCNRKRKETKNTERYMKKRENSNGGEHDCIISSNSCKLEDENTIKSTKCNDKLDKIASSDETSIIIDDLIEFNSSIDAAILNEELKLDDLSLGSDSNGSDIPEETIDDPVARRKAERKAEKKRKKQERRAQRQGRGDPSAGQKQCDMCDKKVDLLIRCTYDESQQWKMVCGKCWKIASGGVVDGDGSHPYYKYGGLWKNRRRK